MNAADLEQKYVHCDIKAEVVAADLVEQGNDIESVVIRPIGSFTRKFRKDILHFQTSTFEYGSTDELLFIDVTREGVFDSLPQGLFYQPEKQAGKMDLENKIEELKKQRQEEVEARKFFSVFEKEFNQCRILTELEERKSIFGMSENFNSDLFTDIWVELREIAPKFHIFLYQILPIAHKCRGNVRLSSILLGFVINENVKITLETEPKMQENPFSANQLNHRFLGTDFVIGDKTPSYDSLYKINIGPLKRNKIHLFLHGGEYEKVILFLLNFFIPYDADFEMNLELEKESENLFLREADKYCYLGFDSKI